MGGWRAAWCCAKRGLPMGINIKMRLMPKGINKIIYNPGVSSRVPVNTLTLVPSGYFFPSM